MGDFPSIPVVSVSIESGEPSLWNQIDQLFTFVSVAFVSLLITAVSVNCFVS